jgi:hypothetical protein
MIRFRPTAIAITGALAIHELPRTPRRQTNLGGIQTRTALNPAAKACSFVRSKGCEQGWGRTAPQQSSASTQRIQSLSRRFSYHPRLSADLERWRFRWGRISAGIGRPLARAIVVSVDAWSVEQVLSPFVKSVHEPAGADRKGGKHGEIGEHRKPGPMKRDRS